MIQIDMVMQRLKGVDMMWRDELIAFEQLSGEDASLKTIGRIGGFLDGYQKAMEKQQWIPCSERLPDDGEAVLVTRDDGTCKIATFEVGEIENGWQMDSWYTEDNVTAWMPLPKPYKGGEK